MARISNLDKYRDVMFTDIATLDNFSPVELEQLQRYRMAFTVCLQNPSVPDVTLRDNLIRQFGISQTQAYRDIFAVKALLPSVRSAGKQWTRYLVEEELKQNIQDAKDIFDECTDVKDKIRASEVRTKAIDKLAKYSRLDKEDEIGVDWEDIIPIPVEPTNDVTVLGVKPIPNKKDFIEKLYNKYKSDIEIEDIKYEEITDDEANPKNIL